MDDTTTSETTAGDPQTAGGAPPAPARRLSTGALVALALAAAATIAVVALLVTVGPFAGDEGPRFTGEVSAPGGGRAWRVTAWYRTGARALEKAVAAQAVDEVDFDWYASKSDGSIAADNEDLELVRRTREQDLQAFATVTNWGEGEFSGDVAAAILASPESRRRHVDALVALALDKGFDGIDVDWESIDPADRDRFSEFVEELADALHDEDRLLSIAVFPKTSEPGQWDTQKPYDYRRLGAAVDEFKIMTYSFSGPWGEPGPQTPLHWANEVLTFAATQVAPDKTYFGVPFYGFDWHAGTATAVHSDDAAALIMKYRPEVAHDPGSKEAVFSYTDDEGVAHTVYFQDRTSIAAKLALLRNRHPGVAGIAVWELLDEDPRFWKVIARRSQKEEGP